MLQTYTQCTLEQRLQSGLVAQTCYIPTKLAILNTVLKIKSENGCWVDGWVVAKIYSTICEIPDIQKSRRQHRKNTGDSLPQ
jgi:hypothetical protein